MVCFLSCMLQPCFYNDDVRAEFCSDVNSVCCRTKLSKLLSDDWSKNDDEEWGESDLNDCKSVVYKVKNGIKLTLLKNGKDDLQVNKLVVETENLRGASASYDCKDIKLASSGVPCVEGVTYNQDNHHYKEGWPFGQDKGLSWNWWEESKQYNHQ